MHSSSAFVNILKKITEAIDSLLFTEQYKFNGYLNWLFQKLRSTSAQERIVLLSQAVSGFPR